MMALFFAIQYKSCGAASAKNVLHTVDVTSILNLDTKVP
jgi:hypothetical protein